MNIAIDGNNFFHTGWMTRLLGLPRQHPAAGALKSGDLLAFEDGWDTCDETPTCDRLYALLKMIDLGQVAVRWVNDENEEVI